METATSSSSSSSSVITKQRMGPERMRMENPFTLKVGQVFTGFGVGCGIGIGVGRPINLGAIPMLGQVMSAARGATDALSGVGRHVNGSLKKIGAKNIEAGIGCGIGFGHGFGVGLGVKPSVLHQVQSSVVQAMTKMMMKFGVAPDMFFGQGSIPASLQSGISMTSGPSNQNPVGSIMNLATKAPDHTFQGQPRDANLNVGTTYETFASKDTSLDTSFGSRTEKVINNFLQNPLLNEGKVETNELAGRLRSENNMLQMVLKHQQIIDNLMEENEKLRQILVEDLKVSPSKLQASYSSLQFGFCNPSPNVQRMVMGRSIRVKKMSLKK